jgi:hypothetical protein
MAKGQYKSRFRNWRKKRKTRRKSSGMKVAHKNMLKGAGVLFALLIFKPQIPISLAAKAQSLFGGGASGGTA